MVGIVSDRYIDPATFQGEPFGRIVWNADAAQAGDLLSIINGANRMSIMLARARKKRMHLGALKEAMVAAQGHDLQTLREEHDTTLEEIRMLSSWGVVIYSRGASSSLFFFRRRPTHPTEILEASEHAFVVFYRLASNKAAFLEKDEEPDDLGLVLRYIACHPAQERRDVIRDIARRGFIDPERKLPSRLAPALHHVEFFLSLTDLHRYSSSWEREWLSLTRIHSQTPALLTVSPAHDLSVDVKQLTNLLQFMKPLMDQAVMVLDFLSSSFDPTDLDLEEVRERLLDSPPKPLEGFFDHPILAHFLQAYRQYLYPHRSAYGVRETQEASVQAYSAAYELYVASIKQYASTWVQSCLRLESETSDGFIQGLQFFERRLDLVLDEGLFNSVRFGLQFPSTFSPLPNEFFMIDIVDGLCRVHEGLNQALCWIEPFYGARLKARTDLTPYGLLKARMRQLVPEEDPLLLLHEILSHLFSSRMPTLAELALLNPLPVKQYSRKSNQKATPQSAALFEAIKDALECWTDHNTDRSSRFILPDPVDLPEEVQTALDEVSDEHNFPLHGVMASTAFPWLATVRRQKKCNVKPLASWLVFVSTREKSTESYRGSPHYWPFRHGLRDLIRERAPRFAWWTDPEAAPVPPLPLLSQNVFTVWERTNVKSAAYAIKKGTQALIDRLSVDLLEIDAGAIVTPTGDVYLHPTVYSAAMNLFKASVPLPLPCHDSSPPLKQMMLASHRRQTTYVSPHFDRLAELEDADVQAICGAYSIPEALSAAPPEALAVSYQPLSKDQLERLDALGQGSLPLQLRQDARLVKAAQALKRDVRMLDVNVNPKEEEGLTSSTGRFASVDSLLVGSPEPVTQQGALESDPDDFERRTEQSAALSPTQRWRILSSPHAVGGSPRDLATESQGHVPFGSSPSAGQPFASGRRLSSRPAESRESSPFYWTASPAPLCATQRPNAHGSSPTPSRRPRDTDDSPPSIPVGAHPVFVSNRFDTPWPSVYRVDAHALVAASDQRPIYILLMDLSKKDMATLNSYGATRRAPKDETALRAQGYLVLRAVDDPIVIIRDMYGSGRDEDDTLTSWCLPKRLRSDQDLARLRAVRNKVLGPEELLNDRTAFQRHPRSVPLEKSPNCYPLGITYQVPRSMSAPTQSDKLDSLSLDEDAQTRLDLCACAAKASIEGIPRGPPGLMEYLEVQAELTNQPRTGHDDNVVHPTMQLNIAEAQPPDSDD
ncbi:hypothetical protein CVT26_011428, partial [Gymnopilus dilepis]